MTAPKLRFKEFDGDWKRDFVGTVISHKSKKFDPTKESRDLRCIELEHLSQNTGQIIDTVPAKDQKSIKNVFDENSILFGKLRPYLKKFAKPNFQGVCSSEIWVLTSKVLVPDFMFQYIQTDYFFELTQIQSGSKMPRADWESVSKGELGFPDRLEQTKIAAFFSAVDEKISQLTQKHQLLSQYKQGMMQKLFSQQIRFKADDGSEFREWERAKVGNITETIFGYPFDSKDMVEDNSGIPLMRGINIGERHIRHSLELDRFFLKDISKLEKYFVQVNDIVLSMDGSKVGRNSAFVTIKDTGSLLVQRVCILREKENTNIQYVYQWIISKEFHRYVDQVKTSSGIPHISGKQIQDYEISYPCLEEQTKIANFLSVIDQKIEMVTQQIEQAKTWKKGLLQQMFV